ncbi:hypothetical protein GGD83_003311 [Rhodoblastus sphagnicola]|nr:hypothetical protein [Rhodoblastus sphagnicola]MBB4199495.1 hypothetical protein [Rhodoblastus sphagnicola]
MLNHFGVPPETPDLGDAAKSTRRQRQNAASEAAANSFVNARRR